MSLISNGFESTKAPLTGHAHLEVKRRFFDNGIMIYDQNDKISMPNNFYKPVIFQGKNKVINSKFTDALIVSFINILFYLNNKFLAKRVSKTRRNNEEKRKLTCNNPILG